MDKELTAEEIFQARRINDLQEKLVNLINEERVELYEIYNSTFTVNIMCVTSVMNLLTGMVASDIYNKIIQPGSIEILLKDFVTNINSKIKEYEEESKGEY